MNPDPMARAVLDYWLGPDPDDAVAADERWQLWYRGGSTVDDEVRARFGKTVESALGAEPSVWRWQASPLGATALVIVLDQFTRNLFRGTPKAYAGDALAIEVAARVVAEKADRGLSVLARLFLYHPFHHAENLAGQDRALALFANLVRESPPHWSAHLKPHLDAVREHRATVYHFGRFPHRNEVLGRLPTAAETAYLLSHSNAFGQRLKEGSDDS